MNGHGLRQSTPLPAPDARVLYLQYTDPAAYPPLEHGARLLADAGCEVLFVGIDVTHGALRLAPHDRVAVRLMPPQPPGWYQKIAFLRFVWWSVAEARRWKPTWIYASDTLSTPAALAVRVVTGAQLIYHEHDAPAESPMSVFMRLAHWCRRRVVSAASLLVVPSRERTRYLGAAEGDARVVVVPNTPMRAEVRDARTVVPAAMPLRVLYHGSIVPARVPLGIIDAMADLPDGVTLTIAGYDPGGGGHLAALRARVHDRGIADRVHVVGMVPTRGELLDLAASCDVGLALMPSASLDANEQTMLGASNKPFDYLACGLALLVTDLPGWREMYVRPGYGLACVPESATSIATALRWFLAHPAERQQMGESGRRRVLSDWNYEREFGPVAQCIGTKEAAENGLPGTNGAAVRA